MPPLFAVEVVPRSRTVVVVASGEVDMESAPALSDAVDEALTHSRHLVMDLSAVTFLASCGLGVLATAANLVGNTGSVTVRNPIRSVHRVLEISGLINQLIILTEMGTARPA